MNKLKLLRLNRFKMDIDQFNAYKTFVKRTKKGQCQRCGKINQSLMGWNGWKICPDCAEDKANGVRNEPDLEDLCLK